MHEAGKAYSRIYAFDPSLAKSAEAARRLSGHKNIEIVQKGLWSAEKHLTFFECAQSVGSSFVIGGGAGQALPVTSLDTFFRVMPDEDLPTFIKMDIEGAEREALLGAAGIIPFHITIAINNRIGRCS
jgi:FkbM family methyltransferase